MMVRIQTRVTYQSGRSELARTEPDSINYVGSDDRRMIAADGLAQSRRRQRWLSHGARRDGMDRESPDAQGISAPLNPANRAADRPST
jgi:hypothetical protein